MNADEEIDESEVTESSQMISALEQDGRTHDLAMIVYNEIGVNSYNSIKEIRDAIDAIKVDPQRKEELYKIFAKALIYSFSTGQKDTLGLAQSFIARAQRDLDAGKFDYKIPFSSASISGIFTSTVTSNIVKKAIRRHFPGNASVLHPAHGIMQVYNFNGMNYKYEELLDVIDKVVDSAIAIDPRNEVFRNWTVDDFISKPYIVLPDGSYLFNPFVTTTSV